MAKTHFKKLQNPNFLGAYSIEDGKDLVLTIAYVQKESVVGADGKKEDCIVCHWQEKQKPMILNSGNCKTIWKLTGSPYIEDWTGVRIQIGVERVKAFGDIVDALRVRKKLPEKQQGSASNPGLVCEVCGKQIVAAYSYTAEQVAESTFKRFGKRMCSACGTAESEKRKAAES